MLENGNAVLVRLDARREAVRRPWCVGRGTADGEAEASTCGLSSWDCCVRLLLKLLRKWAQQAVLPMLQNVLRRGKNKNKTAAPPSRTHLYTSSSALK